MTLRYAHAPFFLIGTDRSIHPLSRFCIHRHPHFEFRFPSCGRLAVTGISLYGICPSNTEAAACLFSATFGSVVPGMTASARGGVA